MRQTLFGGLLLVVLAVAMGVSPDAVVAQGKDKDKVAKDKDKAVKDKAPAMPPRKLAAPMPSCWTTCEGRDHTVGDASRSRSKLDAIWCESGPDLVEGIRVAHSTVSIGLRERRLLIGAV